MNVHINEHKSLSFWVLSASGGEEGIAADY